MYHSYSCFLYFVHSLASSHLPFPLQTMATLPSKPNLSVNFFIKSSLFNPISSICRVWVYYSINTLKFFSPIVYASKCLISF